MGLIEIPARQSDLRPIDRRACRQRTEIAQGILEALDTAKQFGGKADVLRKKLDEMAIAETELLGDRGNRPSWPVAEIFDSERDGRMRRFDRRVDETQKCLLQDFEFGLGRARGKELFAQIGCSLASPKIGKRNVAVLQFSSRQS